MNDLALVEELELEPWPDDADLQVVGGRGDWFEAIDGVPPNPATAAIVTMLEAGRMDGHDQLRLIKAQAELVSYATARLYRSMVELVDTIAASDDLDSNAPEEAAAAEIAAALHLTRRSADNELTTALDLNRRLPAVLTALTEGKIDTRRATTLLRGTEHLRIADARAVVADILPYAPGLTSGQLVAALRRRCIDIDPGDAYLRYEIALTDRRVVAEPQPDGTASLHATALPPDRLAAGMARVDHLARSLRVAGEGRTMDQLRADVLLDLLEGTGVASNATRGSVDIRVDLTTLAELTETSADLAGYGPVVAEIARSVAQRRPRAAWQATVTDPDTGDPIAVVPVRRRPSAQHRREVRAHYPTCVWPGCRMPATRSDLDHRRPHAAGGPATPDNLAPLCRHHHTIRHNHGWRYERDRNGDHRFISPLGHQYATPARGP